MMAMFLISSAFINFPVGCVQTVQMNAFHILASTLINNLNARLDKEKYRLVSFAKGGAFYSPLGTYINPKNGKSRFDKNIDKIRSEFLDNKDTKKIIVISYKYRQHLNDNSNIYVSDDFDSDNKISPIDPCSSLVVPYSPVLCICRK